VVKHIGLAAGKMGKALHDSGPVVNKGGLVLNNIATLVNKTG
jgi:hypothetical protein